MTSVDTPEVIIDGVEHDGATTATEESNEEYLLKMLEEQNRFVIVGYIQKLFFCFYILF